MLGKNVINVNIVASAEAHLSVEITIFITVYCKTSKEKVTSKVTQ